MLKDLIEKELSDEDECLGKEDWYDEYAEDCFLGARLNTHFRGDKNTSSMETPDGSRLFAKITPSWITIEK